MLEKLLILGLIYLVGPTLASRGHRGNHQHSALWQDYGVTDGQVKHRLLSDQNNVTEAAARDARNKEGRSKNTITNVIV